MKTKHTKELKKEFKEKFTRRYKLFVPDGEYFESDAWEDVWDWIEKTLTSREEQLIEEVEKDFNKYVRGSYDHPYGLESAIDRMFSRARHGKLSNAPDDVALNSLKRKDK